MLEREIRERYGLAVRNGDIATVERMLAEHPDLLATRRLLDDALRVAARSNQLAVAELLVRRGADVNAGLTEIDPRGAIHLAAADGAVEGVRWLLKRGVEPFVVEDGAPRCPGLDEVDSAGLAPLEARGGTARRTGACRSLDAKGSRPRFGRSTRPQSR
ncbi:MAG: ankyrin repeat domain-containing protein [Isosphaeraceae bacterium]